MRSRLPHKIDEYEIKEFYPMIVRIGVDRPGGLALHMKSRIPIRAPASLCKSERSLSDKEKHRSRTHAPAVTVAHPHQTTIPRPVSNPAK